MNPFDTELVLWLNGFAGRSPGFDAAMQIVACDYLLPLVFVLVLIGLWFSGPSARIRALRQRAAFVGMAALGLANIPVMIINANWFRPRPFVDLGDQVTLLFYPPTDPSSFPSNVAAVGFAIAASVWMVHRSLGYALFAAAVLLAFSRVYLGVAYPTDVVAGAAIGVIVAAGTMRLFVACEPLPTLAIRLARALCLG